MKYQDTYRVETTRLKTWDYGSRGFYFVTICTKNKQAYFGRIVNSNAETQNIGAKNDETRPERVNDSERQTGKNIDTRAGENVETQNVETHAGNNVKTHTGYSIETHAGNNVETHAGNNVETQNFASLRAVHMLTRIGDVANKYWHEIPQHFPFVELDAFVIMPDHIHGILFLNRPKSENWRTNAFKPQSENLASVVRGFKAAVKKYAVIHQLEFDWQPRYHDRVVHSEMD